MIGALSVVGEGSPQMTVPPDDSSEDRDGSMPVDPESSFALVQRARAGDKLALDQLFERYSQRLRRWAHGRLPPSARSISDTHDLVQDTMLKVYMHFDRFQPRHAGAFLAYVRQTLHNTITDRIRGAKRRPTESIDESLASAGPTQHDEMVATELLDRYDAALARLKPDYREAIIARLELGLPWPEVMDALHKPSIPAAQMTVSRAIMRLAQEMSYERKP